MKELDAIRNNGAPVILYGASLLASRLYKFMSAYGIAIEHIAVDEKYAGNPGSFYGREIISIERLLADERKYNYVVGFAPKHGVENIKNKLQVNALSTLVYDFGYGFIDNAFHHLSAYYSYLSFNKNRLETLYSWLGDDLSRKTLAAFIEQKITGKFGVYGAYYDPHHYFPDDVVTLGPKSVFVDCGAYTGDTIDKFMQKLSREGLSEYESIYAFEPNKHTFATLSQRTAGMPNCHLIPKGAWENEQQVSLREEGAWSRITPAGDSDIEVARIDSVLNGQRVSFIKMDVEGAELGALRGAAHTIKKGDVLDNYFNFLLTICFNIDNCSFGSL